MQVKPDTPRLVIAYKRFSTKKQESGDSLARQHAAALRWCAQKGLELDTELTFDDAGRSGFKGHNSKKGALRTLVDLCKSGRIPPGSYILFEAFDRMTRLPLDEAQTLFRELLETGVVVVTLNNGKEWRRKNLRNISDYLFSVLDLFRGNQESERKSMMLIAAFKSARESGEKWKFASLPGWIGKADGRKDGEFVIKEELAASVVRVFESAALGFNSRDIARRANAEGWPIPARLQQSKMWTADMPRRLLLNRAVLGEHEHLQYYIEREDDEGDVEIEYLTRGKSTGKVVADYYPRIVSDELWAAARIGISASQSAPKRDYNRLNFWSGMLFCGTCGAPMHRRQDIKRAGGAVKGSIVCSAAKDGRTDCRPMAFYKFDVAVLHHVAMFAASELGVPISQRSAAEAARVLEHQLNDVTARKQRVLAAIESAGHDEDLLERLRQLSAEAKALSAKLSEAKEQADISASGSAFDSSFVELVRPHLYALDEESANVRASLFLKLNRLVAYISVFPYDCAIVYFKGSPQRLIVPLPHKSHIPKPQPRQLAFYAGDLQHAEPQRPIYQTNRFR